MGVTSNVAPPAMLISGLAAMLLFTVVETSFTVPEAIVVSPV